MYGVNTEISVLLYQERAGNKAVAEQSLSIEQQFNLRSYQEQIKSASREELEELFLEVLRQKMMQENLFKRLIKP